MAAAAPDEMSDQLFAYTDFTHSPFNSLSMIATSNGVKQTSVQATRWEP